jgi:hypothetical protein
MMLAAIYELILIVVMALRRGSWPHARFGSLLCKVFCMYGLILMLHLWCLLVFWYAYARASTFESLSCNTLYYTQTALPLLLHRSSGVSITASLAIIYASIADRGMDKATKLASAKH